MERTQMGRICPSVLLFCILLVPGSTHDRKGLEPEFDVELPNLTIKQGSDASFTCIVKHLGEFKVAWIRSEDKAILAWHNHMVTHNLRFSVTHNGHNTWTLHIKNVQQNDSGTYMCQVNTDPQRSQYGTLDVVVPADIIDTETSNDVIVSEGQTAILKCKATGYPPPKVRWKRQDGQPLPISRELLSNPSEKFEIWEGERLALRPLQRADTGPYLCIANNSVPPLVSKRVMVYVHFQPSIKVLNQLVAVPLGENITLECYVEAVPKPALSWFNKEGQLILNSVGKIWQEAEILKDYSLRMRLSISNLQKEDFTEYNCTAGNALGADYAIIKLQQLPTPITSKPTMTTTTHLDVWRPNKHSNNNGGGGTLPGGTGNIKHAKNHRRKFQRNRQGHGGGREGEFYEGGVGEDGSSILDMSGDVDLLLTTAPSSSYGANGGGGGNGGGSWGDRATNTRNSQRSAKDGPNSINNYNRNSNNNNNRYGGGEPNLASSSTSSRLISSQSQARLVQLTRFNLIFSSHSHHLLCLVAILPLVTTHALLLTNLFQH